MNAITKNEDEREMPYTMSIAGVMNRRSIKKHTRPMSTWRLLMSLGAASSFNVINANTLTHAARAQGITRAGPPCHDE